jgi:transposase
MKENDAGYFKPDALQYVRERAIKLFLQCNTRKQIAQPLGVNRNAVGVWVKLYQARGMKGLNLKRPGRKTSSGRRLSADQEKLFRKWVMIKCPINSVFFLVF